MRGTQEPMDTITRAEFDDRMKNLATKDDLADLRASTKSDHLPS